MQPASLGPLASPAAQVGEPALFNQTSVFTVWLSKLSYTKLLYCLLTSMLVLIRNLWRIWSHWHNWGHWRLGVIR